LHIIIKVCKLNFNFFFLENSVKIIPNEEGDIIRKVRNNLEYGCIKLQQKRVSSINTLWVKSFNITCFVIGTIEWFQKMDLNTHQTLSGKIIILESLELEPFSMNKNPERDYKIAGDTGLICSVDGQPIYRKTAYTYDEKAEDVLIEMNNKQQLDQKINEHYMSLFLMGNFKALLEATKKLIDLNIKSQLIFYYAGLAAQELELNNLAKDLYNEALGIKDGINIYGGGPTKLFILNNLSNVLFDLEEFNNCNTNCQEFLSLIGSYSQYSVHKYIVNNYYLSAASIVNLHRNYRSYIDQNNMLGQIKFHKIKNELLVARQSIDKAIQLTTGIEIIPGDYFPDDYNSVRNKILTLLS